MTDVVQPVVCESQHQKILGFLNDAKAEGVEVVTDGGVPDADAVEAAGGYYIQPTVLTNVARAIPRTSGRKRSSAPCCRSVRSRPSKKRCWKRTPPPSGSHRR